MKKKVGEEKEEGSVLLLEYATPVFRIHKRTVCLRTAAMYTGVQ